METFLLGMGQRLLQVGIQDERGSGGAVLTLTDEGSGARVFPVRPNIPASPKAPGGDEPAFPIPTLPQGLTEEPSESVDQLVLDTSDLPSALLVFAVGPFIEQVARHAHSPRARIRLTLSDADTWGLIEQVDHEP